MKSKAKGAKNKAASKSKTKTTGAKTKSKSKTKAKLTAKAATAKEKKPAGKKPLQKNKKSATATKNTATKKSMKASSSKKTATSQKTKSANKSSQSQSAQRTQKGASSADKKALAAKNATFAQAAGNVIKAAGKVLLSAATKRKNKSQRNTEVKASTKSASGKKGQQPDPAKGPKLKDPRGKESMSGQGVEPTIDGGTPQRGAPIPDATAEGVAPHGVPYKPEYVSKHALNEKAGIAKGIRKPRGTATHTYASPGHGRGSSGSNS